MDEHQLISIIDHFEDLPDPRQQGKVLYPLAEIILTSLSAIICGADSYVEIAEFGEAKIDFLKQFLPVEHGIQEKKAEYVITVKENQKNFMRR